MLDCCLSYLSKHFALINKTFVVGYRQECQNHVGSYKQLSSPLFSSHSVLTQQFIECMPFYPSQIHWIVHQIENARILCTSTIFDASMKDSILKPSNIFNSPCIIQIFLGYHWTTQNYKMISRDVTMGINKNPILTISGKVFGLNELNKYKLVMKQTIQHTLI